MLKNKVKSSKCFIQSDLFIHIKISSLSFEYLILYDFNLYYYISYLSSRILISFLIESVSIRLRSTFFYIYFEYFLFINDFFSFAFFTFKFIIYDLTFALSILAFCYCLCLHKSHLYNLHYFSFSITFTTLLYALLFSSFSIA